MAGLATGLLALTGCGTTLDAPPPKTHFSKDSIQHMYDTGQISYPVYCQEMQSLDPNWTPSSPPPADKKYGQFIQ
jgi:hypothetical protein